MHLRLRSDPEIRGCGRLVVTCAYVQKRDTLQSCHHANFLVLETNGGLVQTLHNICIDFMLILSLHSLNTNSENMILLN